MFGSKAKEYLLDVAKHTHIYFILKAFFLLKIVDASDFFCIITLVVCGICPVRFFPGIGVYRMLESFDMEEFIRLKIRLVLLSKNYH